MALGIASPAPPSATGGIRQCLLQEATGLTGGGQRNRGVRQSGKVESGEKEELGSRSWFEFWIYY